AVPQGEGGHPRGDRRRGGAGLAQPRIARARARRRRAGRRARGGRGARTPGRHRPARVPRGAGVVDRYSVPTACAGLREPARRQRAPGRCGPGAGPRARDAAGGGGRNPVAVNTDATWQHADAVFGELMRVPPTVRPARLAAMDLPEAVRARVERMLQAFQGDASGILDEPRTMTAALQVGALAGRRLGRWRLQGEIGRGGMAVVYRAVSVEAP